MRHTDIAIIGGGLAGSTTAAMLGRAGVAAVLIDPRPAYPPDFRVEKLGGREQIERFRKISLAESVIRAATRDTANWIGRFGYLLDRRPIEQYGIMYDQLVNAIRAEIPPGVEAIFAKALPISTSAERPTVALSNGEVISARLVVLATGLNVGLRHTVGVERRIISACHSISIGRGRLRRLTVFARCRSTRDCTGGPSAGRALWSGLPKACCGACATGSTRSRNFALNPRHHRRRCRRRPDRPPGAAYGSDRPRASGTRRWRRAVPHASRARSPCRPISR
jgi:2-polyprenyl-6-methoxyphenol hydroxylase-like FAD-dependent oxidoreductase